MLFFSFEHWNNLDNGKKHFKKLGKVQKNRTALCHTHVVCFLPQRARNYVINLVNGIPGAKNKIGIGTTCGLEFSRHPWLQWDIFVSFYICCYQADLLNLIPVFAFHLFHKMLILFNLVLLKLILLASVFYPVGILLKSFFFSSFIFLSFLSSAKLVNIPSMPSYPK